MALRILVDFDLCDSHGECVTIAPEVFDIDAEDRLQILDENPSEELRAKVEAAARRCPKLAITIEG